MKKNLVKVISLIIIIILIPLCVLAQNPYGFSDESIGEVEEYAYIPKCKVTFNGQEVDSINRQYPLLQFRDIVYFPMTYYDCRFLGVSTKWNGDTNNLEITKENISGAYRNYNWEWKNGKSNEITICNFNIIVNGKEIDNKNEEYPLILFRNVTYFPLTWRFAVDEFGWEYSYTEESGLKISADNYICRTLPVFVPDHHKIVSAAADKKYYYYECTDNKIYRAPAHNLSQYECIHTIPDNYISDQTMAYFSYDNGQVYVSYHIGGASTGIDYNYKINSDGTFEKIERSQNKYSGYNHYTLNFDGFSVSGYNSGHPGSTIVYYTKDGIDKQIVLENIRFGEQRYKNQERWTYYSVPQVTDENIYLTGYPQIDDTEEKIQDVSDDSPSNLYCVDTQTGTVSPVLNNISSFFVFRGWDNASKKDSDIVLYYRDGKLYRYSVESKENVVVDENSLPINTGISIGEKIYLCTQDYDRIHTIVKEYDRYAICKYDGRTLLDTFLGADTDIRDGKLITRSYGEMPGEDIHTCIFRGTPEPFKSSDIINPNYFLESDKLLYIPEDLGRVVEVKFEEQED